MKNAISFDIEEWYHAELVRKSQAKQVELVEQSTQSILDTLDARNITATFFILGDVVKKSPNVLRKIYDAGHEIASHGYSHTILYELNEKSFEKEILETDKLIQKTIGIKPLGFRAPSFSINNSTKWALDILENNDYLYDSSIFPVKTHLYGVPNAPLHVYKPSKTDVAKHDAKGKLFEVPMATAKIGAINVPIAGGFYLRALPNTVIKQGIKQLNRKGIPAVMYAHPWELHDKTPRIDMESAFSNFITYWNLGDKSLKKLDSILDSFEFGPVIDLLANSKD